MNVNTPLCVNIYLTLLKMEILLQKYTDSIETEPHVPASKINTWSLLCNIGNKDLHVNEMQ